MTGQYFSSIRAFIKNLVWIAGLQFGAFTNAPGFEAMPDSSASPQLIQVFTLPRTSLETFAPANRHYDLEAARKAGLKFIDLPSIGSGLVRRADDALFGITDRGPNGENEKNERVFPLPDFCPAIVQLALTNESIRILRVLPLTGTNDAPLSGLSNYQSEEPGFSSPAGGEHLATDPGGVDTESIRCLPRGGFVLTEEYSPSVLVVSASGEVLTRYTPVSKPLAGAPYPVQPILPDIFCQRRVNRGFESVALSRDGRTLYAVLQSPMGEKNNARYSSNRHIRILQMDFTHPLKAKVTGMYLFSASRYTDYPQATKQDNIKVCDAIWLAPKRLLLLEHGPSQTQLRVADFSAASNILNLPIARTLQLENVHTDLSALGIREAKVTCLFNAAEIPGIDRDKLEGLALWGPDEVALSNDNDFGIGENPNGEPSKIWVLRLPALRHFLQ